MTEGNYVAAYQKLDEMIEIKDSKDKKLDCAVQIQVNLIKENPASEWDKTVRNNIQRLGYQRRYIIAKAYYNAGNLEKFEEMYQYIKGYEDSDKLYGEYNYEKAMQEYNKTNYGTWIENGQFWYNLKIDETGIYYASQTDTKRERWNRMNTIYKEDNGEYFCQGFSGDIYNVKVEGNRLTLVWTNKQDEYDTDWFGNHNKFYRK